MTTGTLDARAVDTDSFYNAGLSVFGGTLQSENFNLAAGTGWRITRQGHMNMPNAVIDTLKIADGGTRASEAAITALLIDAGLLDADHPVARRLLTAPLTNWRGLEVAELRTAAGFPA